MSINGLSVCRSFSRQDQREAAAAANNHVYIMMLIHLLPPKRSCSDQLPLRWCNGFVMISIGGGNVLWETYQFNFYSKQIIRLHAFIPYSSITKRQISCFLVYSVRRNLGTHRSVTPFVIRQPIRRPCLLERVYKPMRTPHWHGDLQSLT